jgi:hypothetical protein
MGELLNIDINYKKMKNFCLTYRKKKSVGKLPHKEAFFLWHILTHSGILISRFHENPQQPTGSLKPQYLKRRYQVTVSGAGETVLLRYP